jgi:integrase
MMGQRILMRGLREWRFNSDSIQRSRRFKGQWLGRLNRGGNQWERRKIHDMLILLMLGVRRGEKRGLRWRVIDDPATMDEFWVHWSTFLRHTVDRVDNLGRNVEVFPLVTSYHLPSWEWVKEDGVRLVVGRTKRKTAVGAFSHTVVGLREENFAVVSKSHSYIPVEIDLPSSK